MPAKLGLKQKYRKTGQEQKMRLLRNVKGRKSKRRDKKQNSNRGTSIIRFQWEDLDKIPPSAVNNLGCRLRQEKILVKQKKVKGENLDKLGL